MDEILCLKKFEGAVVKYHSPVVFLSSSPNIPRQDKFSPKFEQASFFARNITFCQIEGDLHEVLYQLKFTSLKTKLLPNISKLCCYNRIFCFLY